MKKFSLLLLLFPFLLNAQDYRNYFQNNSDKYVVNLGSWFKDISTPATMPPVFKRGPSTTPISSSGNIYGNLVTESTVITANQATNTILFTYRGNAGVNAADVGDILVSFSVDLGNSWNKYVALPKTQYFENRYPSGVIYNPAGNTNTGNAYAVYAGPSHDGKTTAHWYYNFFGAIQFDSSYNVSQYILNPKSEATDTVDEIFFRNNMASTDDGKVHIFCYGGYYDVNSLTKDSITMRYFMMRTGTFNPATHGFDWTDKKVQHSLKIDTSSRPTLRYTSVSAYGSAWKQDGTVGYLYFLGRDTNHYRGAQLFVFKSTDQGANWNLYSDVDLCTIPALTDSLIPMQGTTKARPIPTEYDAVVDNSGNLHIFMACASAWSNHKDSLGYYYSRSGGQDMHDIVFHLAMNGTSWDVTPIVRYQTIYVAASSSGFGTGDEAQGWDHRLQASRTTDGTKIFAIWSDTDPANSTINEYPDIYGWGYNFSNSTEYPVTNFTINKSDVAGDNYWYYASDIALVTDGGNAFRIPVSTTRHGDDPTKPVYHNYLKVVYFGTIGINEPLNDVFTVGENYPNPFRTETSIEMTLKKNTNVSLSLVNTLGQTVKTVDYNNLVAGNHQLKMDGTGLNNGVYFLLVKAGGFSKTIKVLVD